MEENQSVFDLFGGIRPMARALSLPPQNIAAWKRVGRIPSEKQPHVLNVARSLGLAVTADDIIFPLGTEISPIDAPSAIGNAPVLTAGSGAQQ